MINQNQKKVMKYIRETHTETNYTTLPTLITDTKKAVSNVDKVNTELLPKHPVTII